MSVNFLLCKIVIIFFFFFKQKTAYEMRISDWSSDVCSSDLLGQEPSVGRKAIRQVRAVEIALHHRAGADHDAPDLARRNKAQCVVDQRSEERRVGKGCVSPCRSRWSPYN